LIGVARDAKSSQENGNPHSHPEKEEDRKKKKKEGRVEVVGGNLVTNRAIYTLVRERRCIQRKIEGMGFKLATSLGGWLGGDETRRHWWVERKVWGWAISGDSGPQTYSYSGQMSAIVQQRPRTHRRGKARNTRGMKGV